MSLRGDSGIGGCGDEAHMSLIVCFLKPAVAVAAAAAATGVATPSSTEQEASGGDVVGSVVAV